MIARMTASVSRSKRVVLRPGSECSLSQVTEALCRIDIFRAQDLLPDPERFLVERLGFGVLAHSSIQSATLLRLVAVSRTGGKASRRCSLRRFVLNTGLIQIASGNQSKLASWLPVGVSVQDRPRRLPGEYERAWTSAGPRAAPIRSHRF
jgi:hypothetical protein